MRTLEHRKDIEGLRGVAILLVIAAHAKLPGFTGGFIGVDIFFVISGFLITGILTKEIAQQGKIDFVRFYARRFRRLLPVLAVVVIATGAAIKFLLPPAEQLGQAHAAASAIFWVSNFYFALSEFNYFDSAMETNAFLHTWSLSVEEQFYLMWPAFIATVYFFHRSANSLRWYITAILLASLLACILISQENPSTAFYMMPLRAWQFAAGALIYLSTDNIAKLKKLPIQISGWLGLSIVIACAIFLNQNLTYPGFWAVLPTIGASLLLIAGTSHTHYVTAKILCVSPLQTVGKISYSWYLWHWPVLVLGSTLFLSTEITARLLLVALSWLLAAITYYCFENPIRHGSVLLKKSGWQITVASCVMAIVGLQNIQWHNQTRQELNNNVSDLYAAAKSDVPIIYQMGCDEWFHSAEVKICRFGAKNTSKTAIIMGDSIGLQWFPALERIFKSPDWELLVITKSACPIVEETIFYPRIGREYTECTTWRESAVKEVAKMRPDILIIGSAENYDIEPASWKNGTQKFLSKVTDYAENTFVIRATPTLPFDGPQCLSKAAFAISGGIGSQCESTATSTKNDEVWESIKEAIGSFDNVHLIDMNPIVCPNKLCSAQRDGVVVFRDAQHLTSTYIQSTYRELKKYF